MGTFVSITYGNFKSILHFFSFQLFQAVVSLFPLGHWESLGIKLLALSWSGAIRS